MEVSRLVARTGHIPLGEPPCSGSRLAERQLTLDVEESIAPGQAPNLGISWGFDVT